MKAKGQEHRFQVLLKHSFGDSPLNCWNHHALLKIWCNDMRSSFSLFDLGFTNGLAPSTNVFWIEEQYASLNQCENLRYIISYWQDIFVPYIRLFDWQSRNCPKNCYICSVSEIGVTLDKYLMLIIRKCFIIRKIHQSWHRISMGDHSGWF